ncbi:TPA: hypothetical protein QCX22_001748 [Bacillus toyonensis]|uniref:hypothetical protein n=1 Tax=Bacillus cereus group TaxID=86661 RepID=UPI0007DB54A5|nr:MULTISPECIES: hypothetical protein [Bacillus cereus group]MBM6767608.1 hypothetical protein [Bacillus cereus]OAK34583.1 hypothetical protein A6285_08615 [Bacillus wiedmannii]HDR7376642.1 hypothetical protein [Bacillus toyonensis]HDR7664585.1 hypothetical protein [Bacillus wiedmannii]
MGKGMKGQPMEWKDEEAKKRSLANLQPNAAMKHGLRSQNFEATLTEVELQQIAKTESDILAQLGDSATSTDKINAERYAIALIKVQRADQIENVSIKYKDFTKELLEIEKQLGLDRRYRLSKSNTENPSNTDWMLSLFDGANEKL